MTWDVVVIGGGPAGLAAAIATARRGLSVTVCDPKQPPIDKGCGEGLMPDAVRRLEGWGVEIGEGDRISLRGIRYIDGERIAEAEFPERPGWGIRRTRLHAALAHRAAELGIALRWGVRATGLTERGVETTEGSIEARWIVGADGLHSKVRRWAGLDLPTASRVPRFGNRRHYEVAPWTRFVEVYWADGAEAYVTPVGAREVGVAILWSGDHGDLDEQLTRFPDLVRRLSGRPVTSRDRGAAALEQRSRRPVAGRVALVGDASGYLDAITGEGLAAAFHHAEALAEALELGRLESYSRRHHRLSRVPSALIRVLLFVERRPWLRRRMVAALADEPLVFDRLLAVHSGDLGLGALGPSIPLRLALALATGPGDPSNGPRPARRR